MRTEEKAMELFYKFNKVTSNNFNSDTFNSATSAKECALITVNEIMLAVSATSYNCSEYTFKLLQEQSIFWGEVKQKLEQL